MAAVESTAAAPLLQVSGVTKRFGGLAALTDVSLTVAPGEVVGLIGPNGAGKSTLFDVITGVARPDTGSVTFASHDLTQCAPHRVAHLGIGRTFQKLRPFPTMTLLENVMVPLVAAGRTVAAARNRAMECVEFVGLGDKVAALADTLSTGQRKRLELARAMALEPQLLLLDEVTAGVDHRSLEPLIDLLERLNRLGAAILVIEHNMKMIARISHRLVMLHLGQVVATGRPAEILGDPHITAIYAGEHHHDQR